MRHLVVGCDGTWNTPRQEAVTNVVRLYNSLDVTDGKGHDQLRYYQQGVGTAGGPVNWILGGASAVGVSANVLDAYHWLVTTYEWGDQIALFGFSRGSYTARSLAGMIGSCGLLDPTEVGDAQLWRQIRQVYGQRYRKGDRADPGWRQGLTFRFDPENVAQFPVHFIGVWETVGAFGIPDNLGLLNLLDPPSRYNFHDLKLNPHLRHARHALAMDETRTPFSPTLMEGAPGQDVKQVWFPGSHLDVGGGHPETGLSDGALQWMIEEAQAVAGLAFHKSPLGQLHPDAAGVLHDDNRGMYGVLDTAFDPVIGPLIEPFFQPRPRSVPRINPQGRTDVLHASVYERHEATPITSGPYRPTRVLAAGQSATVTVAAREPWNETGLYLESGDYRFRARGSWMDAWLASGPAGTTGLRRFSPREGGRLLGTVLGQAEKLFRLLTGNQVDNALFSRREEDAPWMSLIGVVANDSVPAGNGSREHERIRIGAGTDHSVTAAGYLYAFANDAWGFYGNNQGSVRLTVTRTA